MSDTPETDNAILFGADKRPVVLAEFARDLERRWHASCRRADHEEEGKEYNAELAMQFREERNSLLSAVEKLRSAKGRHSTQLAADALFELAAKLGKEKSPPSAPNRPEK